MSDFYIEKKYYIGHPDGWRYIIEEGDDVDLINISYQDMKSNGDWGEKANLIENFWVTGLPKLVEVLNDIIKDKVNIN